MRSVIRNIVLLAVSANVLALNAVDALGSFGLGEALVRVDGFSVDDSMQVIAATANSVVASAPAMAIELPADDREPARPDRTNGDAESLLDGSLPGMADTGSSPQASGAGAAGALANCFSVSIPVDDPLTTRLPELRTVLPRGPTFRWFRPPRM